MTKFEEALAGFSALDDEALARPWPWRNRQMDVRYALYRTLEDAQEAYVRVAASAQPESRRILALAQRAFGDLRGLVIGLPADLLDRAPRAGEWPVREALRHMVVVERRYALQTRYAVERADADAVRVAEERLQAIVAPPADGDAALLLGRVREARAETDRQLGDVVPALMSRPTIWAGYEADVRFRLHRFAAHVIEHTIQCEKILDALGWRAPEGRRIARHLSALLGELEGLGALDDVRDIESRLVERFASVSAVAAGA